MSTQLILYPPPSLIGSSRDRLRGPVRDHLVIVDAAEEFV